MLNFVTKWFSSFHARWRWSCGRCPLCNRTLFALQSPEQASYFHCFCQGQTHPDSRLWNEHLRLLTISKGKGPQRMAFLSERRMVMNEKVSITG